MNNRTSGENQRYELIRLIGKGAYGKVYEAHDCTEKRIVALKTVKYSRNNSLDRKEARIHQ